MESRTDLWQKKENDALCPFLSDLTLLAFVNRTKALLSEIPEEQYSVDDWNGAVSYIL